MSEYIYVVWEQGLVYSPTGRTTWTLYWSDGSVTTEERICPRPIMFPFLL